MKVYDFYTKILKISNEEIIKKLLPVTKYQYFQKKDIIVYEGDNQADTQFLVKGILRGYFTDINGNEITDCFLIDHGVSTTIWSGTQTLPPLYIEALTNCEIISIPNTMIEELQHQYIEAALLYNKILSDAFKEHWEIKTVLYRYSATERYKWFLNKYPGLINKISNKYIASYLKMTTVTLSRLRSEINKNERSNDISVIS